MTTVSPEKILVIQLRRVGDVLLATPAVRALRGAFPEARIDFLVEEAARPVLEDNPRIDRILVRGRGDGLGRAITMLRDVRRARYDVVVDFLGNVRTAIVALASAAPRRLSYRHPVLRLFYTSTPASQHEPRYMVLNKLAVLADLGLDPRAGGDLEELRPEMSVPQSADDYVSDFLQEEGLADASPLVSIDPTSRSDTCRWTAEGFAELADRLTDTYGARVVFLWGPAERDDVAALAARCRHRHVIAPATDLKQLAALIGRCDLHIGNDSGPRHIAVARDTPTLTVMGSTHESKWTFPSELHRVVFEPVACRPCERKTCPTQIECMGDLTAEKVAGAVAAFEKLLPGKLVRRIR